MFFPKDFIETVEGLVFAIVEQGVENGKVLCFLRYERINGSWRKQPTQQANALLKHKYPEYLYYSSVKDVHLHAVAVERIVKHHRPRLRLSELIRKTKCDKVEQDLQHLHKLYYEQGLEPGAMGVTGSVLIGGQTPHSDIDLVFYDLQQFHRARMITRELIAQGLLSNLTQQDWEKSYDRRACHLTFSDYVWHENRKCNKALINGRKFDLSYVGNVEAAGQRFHKCGKIVLQCQILDDSQAYHYPAVFKVDHPEIGTVVSYTATYTGQALTGETVEVSGSLERSETGLKRIIVGSSREAEGEYIKVVQ